MEKPTIYTIARKAEVSTATVSKILNKQGNISRETTARVMEIIKELQYVPQQRKQSGNAIGVVTFLSDHRPLASPFTAKLLNGICREAFALGKDITLIDGDRISALTPEELHCFYAGNSLLGLLGINLAGSSPFCERLRISGIPMVLVANADENGSYVVSSNYESVAEMVDYLVGMGHTRIAHVGLVVQQLESHRQRFQAFRDTLARHGVPVRGEFLLDLPNAERLTIKNALSRLMARPEPPTALFFASEELSPVVPTLRQIGLRIPDDISVAGMALEKPEPNGHPELGAIVQPVEEIGQAAVHCLADLLKSKKTKTRVLNNMVYYGDTVRRLSP